MPQNPHVLLTFDKVHNPLRLPRKTTSEPPKVERTCSVLYIFTSKCASRHNGVHFFDIATSKSGPRIVCFVHFHFEICFAPQRGALFRHRNFQKRSENGVLCTFSLRNVVRATTACTFSRERLRRVLRKKAAVILHLHTFTSADLDLHTFTSADLHLHTLIPADLDLHTFTPADLDLHTFTSADLHLHTFTPADLHLHTFTSADLHLHTFTSADLHLHTP